MSNHINLDAAMRLKAVHISILSAIGQFPDLEQAIMPNPEGHDLVIGIFRTGESAREERLLCWFDDEPCIYYAASNQFGVPELQCHPIPGGVAAACQGMTKLLSAFHKEL
jgi:hypothetical protein